MERGAIWDEGKNCDSSSRSTPLTSDEVPYCPNLSVWLDVDGRRYQDGNTRTTIFPVRFLTSYVTRFRSRQPGDVISVATLPGVGIGQKPNVFLKAGQTM